MRVLFTCEHGGNDVPRAYRALFRGKGRLLASHRGYDPGALPMALYLSRALGCPLELSTVTRLLVDLNRSIGHPSLFSEISRTLHPDARAEVLRGHYHPHRARVDSQVRRLVSRHRRVVHVASHSFTPILDGVVRKADVAWLYDPRRSRERKICRLWRDALRALRPDLRLRRNYPYRGVDDGLVTHLRRTFPASRYIGVELEVNQRWFSQDARAWLQLRRAIAASFQTALEALR